MTNSQVNPRPFLKWPGGKRSIISELTTRKPVNFTAYYELFTGGAALYFELRPANSTLSDINSNLMTTYMQIRDNVDEVIKILTSHKSRHSNDYYYEIRERFPDINDPPTLAADMIYLNRTCFNGMYRENKSGKFNVPVGKYANPLILDEVNLRLVSKELSYTKIVCRDFSDTEIVRDGFYYLDPPYHNTYSQYSSEGFNEDKHGELSEFCYELSKHGAYFMLSNSDTEFIRNLYSEFRIEQVMALRSVSRQGNQRGKANELLIRNY